MTAGTEDSDKAAEDAPIAAPAMATILLVEDHSDSLRVMTRLLTANGYTVLPAATMAEALELARGAKIDLLVSDLGLPDGSGVDLLQSLGTSAGLKAIAISGYDMDEDVRRCHEAGFVRHVTKPVNFQLLCDTIKEVLG